MHTQPRISGKKPHESLEVRAMERLLSKSHCFLAAFSFNTNIFCFQDRRYFRCVAPLTDKYPWKRLGKEKRNAHPFCLCLRRSAFVSTTEHYNKIQQHLKLAFVFVPCPPFVRIKNKAYFIICSANAYSRIPASDFKH